MYCSKSIEWAQEQEVRFFSNNQYVSFSHEMLSGILLGVQCPSNWSNEIFDAISGWTNKPKMFKENIDNSLIKTHFDLLN